MEPSTPARRPVVVKLGGSLITRKRELEKPRPKVLARLAEELASGDGRPIVVLHGAGSFGHPGAKRFGLAGPPADPAALRERARGAGIVSAEVRRLHLLVLRELVRAGLAPWSVPAATIAVNRAGTLARLDGGPFAWALAHGLTPVSFGDVVPDTEWQVSILSADTLAVDLAAKLRAERVIFATDVPGIRPAGATAPKAILTELSDSDIASLRPSPGTPDVTGGIRAKARAMRSIAAGGTDAVLISGLSDGALSRAIRGEAVYGSWAHARAG